jgi:hypothetical protein
MIFCVYLILFVLVEDYCECKILHLKGLVQNILNKGLVGKGIPALAGTFLLLLLLGEGVIQISLASGS